MNMYSTTSLSELKKDFEWRSLKVQITHELHVYNHVPAITCILCVDRKTYKYLFLLQLSET